MRFPPAAAVSLALLALVAPALLTPVARAADSEPIEMPDGEPWRHESSGFLFPPDVGTFTRVSAFRYDDEGRNVSVGYRDRGLKVIMTAYAYPNRGLPLAQHFEQVKADVRQVHPDAAVLAEGAWKLEQDGRKLSGRRAAFSFRITVGGQEREVVSEAYLLRLRDHFIKFRVTCPKERYEAAADRVGRFLQALKVPEPSAASSGK